MNAYTKVILFVNIIKSPFIKSEVTEKVTSFRMEEYITKELDKKSRSLYNEQTKRE